MNKPSQLLICCGILASLLCPVAQAATPATDDGCAAVEDAAVLNPILECLVAEYKKADKQLNAVYQSKMASLDESGKVRLRNEERQWLKSRQAKCLAAGKEFEGGSEQRVEQNSCMVTTTKDRIVAINAFH